MGLMWIPLAIGIQLLLLYAFLGGPGALLARFAGQEYLDDGAGWSRMQVGFPLALVLAFPSLVILAIIEKWVRQVGLMEVAIVQGACLLLLLTWLKRRDPARGDESAPEERTGETDEQAAYPHWMDELAPKPSAEPIMIVPPSVVACARAVRVDAGQARLRTLQKTYMWDDVGLGRPYAEARRMPLARLVSPADVANLGAERFSALRAMARTTVAGIHGGGDAYLPVTASAEALLDRHEYELDVMQRLTLSVVLGHERLFVDRSDVELCGSPLLLTMYRLALFEARDVRAPIPGADRLH